MTVSLGMARPRGDLRRFVASEIRAAMGRQKLTGVGLASIIGKSQPYVSRRLSGRLAFDFDDLEVIARVLNTSPAELVNDAVARLERATADSNGVPDAISAPTRINPGWRGTAGLRAA